MKRACAHAPCIDRVVRDDCTPGRGGKDPGLDAMLGGTDPSYYSGAGGYELYAVNQATYWKSVIQKVCPRATLTRLTSPPPASSV